MTYFYSFLQRIVGQTNSELAHDLRINQSLAAIFLAQHGALNRVGQRRKTAQCTALSRYLQIPELSTFASNLKRVREARGITQEKLAEAADLNVRTLQRIESAKMNPLVSTLIRLQEALGCPWEDLFKKQ